MSLNKGKFKKICALLTIVFLMVSLTSCFDSSKYLPQPTQAIPKPTAKPTQTAPPVTLPKDAKPIDGGELNIAMRLPKTLNPIFNSDESVDSVLKLIFEPLVVLDGQMKPIANSKLVKSFDFATDNKSVLVTLLPDRLWSDGKRVTARDLVFTIEAIRTAPEASIYKHYADNISACNILTENAVKIDFFSPSGLNLYFLRFPIIPQHYYINAGPSTGSSDPKDYASGNINMMPLGSGPYKFVSYTPSVKLVLEASKNSAKKPHIAKINTLVTSNRGNDVYSFNQKIIDVVLAETLQHGLQRTSKSVTFSEIPMNNFEFVGFNFNRQIFQDKQVRQAVAHLLPVDKIIETVYLSRAKKSLTPINPASWLYAKDLPQYEYSKEKAEALLNSAGFVKNGEYWGKKTSDKKDEKKMILEFTILTNSENKERTEIANMLFESLKTSGMKAEVVSVPFEEYTRRINSRDYDVCISGYDLPVQPDLSFMLNSSFAVSGNNIFGYSNPAMDELLYAVKISTGEFDLINAMNKLQANIVDELPFIGISFRDFALITGERVKGEIKPAPDNVFVNVESWFLEGKQ